MIRFSCRKCGKSLRADDSIIGRSSRCTSCRAINRVPQQSTRKSGEKPERVVLGSAPPIPENEDPFGEEVVTLIAESDSDSFEAFENLDFSSLKFEPSPFTPKPKSEIQVAPKSKKDWSSPKEMRTESSRGESDKVPVETSDKSWGGSASIPQTSAAKWPDGRIAPSSPGYSWLNKSPAISPVPLFVVGAISLLAVLGYFGYSYFFSGPRVVEKTELQLSAMGNGHATILMQFKKAERVMSSMENAYRQKRLPEAALSAVLEVKQKAKELIKADEERLGEANLLYSAGDKQGAHKILHEQVESMKSLQKEIETQTKFLERKVFY